ncbi:MAG: hypothetical protein FWG44_00420 [Oscillospiraceae bacterium]|nr:hypothetical protein [Oscillospiraceae bacterium]
MEWKQEHIPKTELEKKQTDYMKEAMDMAKRAKVNPDIAKARVKAKQEEPPVSVPAPAPVSEVIQKPETMQKPEKHEKHEKQELPKAKTQPPRKPSKYHSPKVIEKIIEKPVEVEKVVERVVEKPVVVEKVVKEPVIIEKTVQKAPEIHITNQSKKIEINADVDLNVNVPLIVKGVREEQAPVHEIEIPEEEPEIEEFPQFPEEEFCDEELTEHPFEHFEGCEPCPERPQPHGCKTSRPPNFNNFINEHNRGRRGPQSSGCNERTGGFSWKDFKKN